MRILNKKYWRQCTIPGSKYALHIDKHTAWLEENCQKGSYLWWFTGTEKTTFAFKSEDDMTMFLLRWS